jgi:hypothetical protein
MAVVQPNKADFGVRPHTALTCLQGMDDRGSAKHLWETAGV